MSSLNVEVGIPEIVSERQARRRGARIQELKMRGLEWENGGRFDGRKYEVLCERALREVAYQRVWIDIKDV